MGIERDNIDLTLAQRKEIAELLKRYLPGTEVWAYGSRVKFTSKPSSDLDMVAFTSQKIAAASLREAFEESRLPFRVDFFLWDEIPEQFRENIQAERVVLQAWKEEQGVPSGWREYSLTDLYSIRSGLSKPAKDFGEGYPFLSFKDVFYNYFLPDELIQLVRSNDKEREGCSIQRGDVFFTRTSETMEELGMSSVARKSYPDATFNGFCKRLRPSTDISIHPEFVGYFLRGPKFRNEMLAFSTMSTRASLNNDMISRLRITLPPLPEQKAIAHILGSLDDKIELNRQMNATLEGMAQALFQSWFVNFDPVIDNALAAGNKIPEAFKARAEIRKALGEGRKPLPEDVRKLFPAEFTHTKEMGWIPRGWKVSTIGEEVASVGGGTPSTKNPEFWNDGNFHWTTPKDLSNQNSRILLDTDRKITAAGLSKISSGLLPVDTILMSSRAPVGYLAFAKVPVAINQGYIAMKCSKYLTPEYVMQWAESVMDDIKRRSGGTTFAEISKKNFRGIPLIVPGNEPLAIYSETVGGFYDKITGNLKETQQLENIRDTLLPKLLSGELRVGDGERIV